MSEIQFTPPAGTVDETLTEGEAMVRWTKKPDGTYCIVEFEGSPLEGYEEAAVEETADSQLESLAVEN